MWEKASVGIFFIFLFFSLDMKRVKKMCVILKESPVTL